MQITNNADTQQLTHKQDWHISAHTKIILARSITTTNNTDLEYLTHKWYWQTVSHTQKTDRQYLIQKLYWHTASCTQRILTHNISHTNDSCIQYLPQKQLNTDIQHFKHKQYNTETASNITDINHLMAHVNFHHFIQMFIYLHPNDHRNIPLKCSCKCFFLSFWKIY